MVITYQGRVRLWWKTVHTACRGVQVNITSDAQTRCLRDLTPQREPSTAAEAPPKMRAGPARSITLTPWHMLHHNPQSPAGLQERKVRSR